MYGQEAVKVRQRLLFAPPTRPRILWVHGWGVSSSIWSKLAMELPEFEHRYVSYAGCDTESELMEAVRRPLLEEPDGEWHVIGWSMGGMLLLELLTVWHEEGDARQKWEIGQPGNGGDVVAPRPPAVRSVILTGTTLRFVDDINQAGWPDRVMRCMRRSLKQAAPEDMLRVFAERIPSAVERANAACCWLTQHVVALDHDVTLAGLDAGLAYLQQADLERAWVRLTDTPGGPRLLWLHGADDSICPIAAQERAQMVCGHRNAACFVALPHAGHAPFATQTERWLQYVREWYRANREKSVDERRGT